VLKTARITFASFNTFAKINSEVIALWAKLLHAVPRSRLMLKYRAFGDPLVRRSVLTTFQAHDIAAERLELLDRDASQMTHLERYNSVDIALDPFPYNGTTTTCDALWMGAPVVTLAGTMHAGRVGVSQLSNLGLTELIAETPAQYLAIAAELAGDSARLRQLRAGLRARMSASPLTNSARFTYHLETAYRDIWNNWCSG
jgi:predicted O-linked N-acetylglucosamine transferase (SPINDLY family)